MVQGDPATGRLAQQQPDEGQLTERLSRFLPALLGALAPQALSTVALRAAPDA